MAWLILMLGLAQAQDSEVASPPPGEEIVIWGEHQVRQARAQVVRNLEAQGWKAKGNAREGAIRFKPPSSWMGRLTLYPDGRLEFGRPVLKGRLAKKNPTSQEEAGPAIWVLPSGSRLRGVQDRVRSSLSDDLQQYERILRETVHQQALQALPARLDKLWEEGAALDGSTTLPDKAARRAAVLTHWSTRTETREGNDVSKVLETWLRQVVQSSDAPLTAEEIQNAEAARSDGRKLDL